MSSNEEQQEIDADDDKRIEAVLRFIELVWIFTEAFVVTCLAVAVIAIMSLLAITAVGWTIGETGSYMGAIW